MVIAQTLGANHRFSKDHVLPLDALSWTCFVRLLLPHENF
jgi:hypothetical protein